MSTRTLSVPEIRREGLKALLERLGPDGTLRFLQQFDPGQGDYTRDRRAWLDGVTLDEILKQIKDQQAAPE